MIDERTGKMVSIAIIMDKCNYETNKTINTRINNYNFQSNTTITYNNKYIRISTETKIKGVYNILTIFSNGVSKLCFEFDWYIVWFNLWAFAQSFLFINKCFIYTATHMLYNICERIWYKGRTIWILQKLHKTVSLAEAMTALVRLKPKSLTQYFVLHS